jgi:hypothetical protein
MIGKIILNFEGFRHHNEEKTWGAK